MDSGISITSGKRYSSLLIGIRALAVVLLIPAAYVFGRAYQEAWLVAYKLPPQAFDTSFEDALMYAYLGVLHGAIRIVDLVIPNEQSMLLYWVAAFLLVFISVLAWVFAPTFLVRALATGRKKALRCKLGLHKRISDATGVRRIANPIGRAFVSAYVIASAPVIAFTLALYMLALAVLPPALGAKIGGLEGARAAQEARGSETSDDKDQADYTVYGNEPGKRPLGKLVICGDKGCGVIVGQRVEFISWDSISRISESSMPNSNEKFASCPAW